MIMLNPRWPAARLAACAATLLLAMPAYAQAPWSGETFLGDYTKLQLVPGREGKDYIYLMPGLEDRISKYRSVMLDQPEVFISADSPYKGAKPEDLAAIAGVLRSATATALQERGYAIVDQPGPNTLYVRSAATGLKIAKKKKNLLAYTPVGFVVDVGVKALQDFMDKYSVLDLALQIEIQDSLNQDVLAAGVVQRGKSVDASKPISFDQMVAVADEMGERFACRLDNSNVKAAERIDCTDVALRQARPKIVGP
jgi:hypothetical protein